MKTEIKFIYDSEQQTISLILDGGSISAPARDYEEIASFARISILRYISLTGLFRSQNTCKYCGKVNKKGYDICHQCYERLQLIRKLKKECERLEKIDNDR